MKEEILVPLANQEHLEKEDHLVLEGLLGLLVLLVPLELLELLDRLAQEGQQDQEVQLELLDQQVSCCLCPYF